MEPAPRETPSVPYLRERPGWMAIALIAAFVLAAVGMFLIGARLVKRTPAPDLSAVAVVPFAGASLGADFSIGLTGALAKNRGLTRRRSAESAGTLVEGSVQQSGDRVRVAARLVEPPATICYGPTPTISRSGMYPPCNETSRAMLRPRCASTSRCLHPDFLAYLPPAPFLRVNEGIHYGKCQNEI